MSTDNNQDDKIIEPTTAAPMESIGIDPLDRYRNRMYKPTSRRDLMYMLGGAVRIITYDEITNYKTLDELLDPYQSVIILYPNANEPDCGHWVCCFVMPGTRALQYFDSFGCYLDSKVEEFNENDRGVILHEKRQIEPELIKLILESKYADTTEWNEFEMQSSRSPTNCCGLWCVVRLKNKHLNEYEFEKQFCEIPRNMQILPDLAISAMICKIYPEMA